jgi:hypothetical protein
MNEYKPYRVTLHTTQLVAYVVDARTPEQAEDIAEELFNDGEEPREILQTQTLIEDVEPVEELSSDENYSDSTGFHA